MKTNKIITLLTALLFNVLAGGFVAGATGINPILLVGGGTAFTSLFGSTVANVLPMAIQKEIWTGSLVENIFADNSFMSRATNLDEFVMQGKIVHIPQAGSASNVEKNRTSLPATIKVRRDTDLYFGLDEYTTDPIKIGNAEQVELAYNKRESILRNDKSNLMEEVAVNFIYDWSPASTYVTRTTGSNVTAHVGTGSRKAFTTADVDIVATKFNAQGISQIGRVCLLDAYMYQQLLTSLTASQNADFNKQADLANGILGKYNTFEFMMRGTAAVYSAGLAPKLNNATSVTTDHAAGLFWHPNSVGRALGEVDAFEDLKNPQYYGDIYSFLIRAKGKIIVENMKGIWAVVQDTAA
jgi:hypothetical protein